MLQEIHLCGCRCNESRKDKTDGSTCPTYTGLRGKLEQLKIETKFESEKDELSGGQGSGITLKL